MEFSRQEYWSGLSFPSPGIEPRSPALEADSLPSVPPEKPYEPQGLSYGLALLFDVSVALWGNIF